MSNKPGHISNLSPDEKRALLAKLLREKAGTSASWHPLSYGQRALWFLHQVAPGSAAYNVAFASRIHSDVDVPALVGAFKTLINRHPSLCTTYAVRNGKPGQMIHDHQQVHFEETDVSELSPEDLNHRVVKEYRQAFDLKRGPVVRVKLFTQSTKEHIFLLTIHHIAADLQSLEILINELRVLYPAEKTRVPASLPPLELKYTDYIQWQNKMLASTEGERLWTYWKIQLSGKLPVLDLPFDRPRPLVQTFRGSSQDFKLEEDLTLQLKKLAASGGVTLYVVLLAAFYGLLYRCTGQEDILVGSPMAGRSRPELKGIVGYFVNPVVLRADLSGNPSFKNFIGGVHQLVLAALEHQDFPLPLLVERLQPERHPGRSPLFQVTFLLQRLQQSKDLSWFFVPGNTGIQVDFGGLEMEPFPLAQQEGQFDLELEMGEVSSSLYGRWKYNPDLFNATTIARMAGHYQTLLESITANPGQRISDLQLLTKKEQHQILVTWNNTQVDIPGDITLTRMFETQVELTPYAAAVLFEDEILTYCELNNRVNQLAHHLRKLGVGPEIVVPICMERSLEMVIGIYGILKAGGAYIPLDPEYPKERLAFILEDIQTGLVLTQQRLAGRLPNHGSKKVIGSGSDRYAIAGESTDNPVYYTKTENLAYVIYTSGSTGVPKGAMNSHHGICNRLTWMQDAYQLTTEDHVLQKTPFSFDVSVWEFFWPLFTGASLVVARPGGHLDSTYLVKIIAHQKITTLHFVPAMLGVFLEEQGLEACTCLKRVICSGEALPYTLQERFFARMSAELHNLYGPTEAAVDVTYWACKRENVRKLVPIGRPISNIQIYLLDSYQQPVPIGTSGELHIGGIGLARGYCNRPELTAEKFIPDPFSSKPWGRLYKSGDLARYLPDGNIEFLGRLDHQVKIRGFRIELGEIETVLRQHPAVRETIVVTREYAPEDKRLAAYLVPNRDPAPTISELRGFLKAKLPDYMVPAVFITMDALPLMPNGKVNRRALPEPDGLRPELETLYVMPRTEVERTIASAWKEVLNIEKVGMYDNFFDLGGHSLLMVQVHSKLQEMYKQDLSIMELFQYPTVSSMAKFLTGGKSKESALQQDDRIEKIKVGKDRLKQQFKQKQLATKRGENPDG